VTRALPLSSYKIRFHDVHIRAMPAVDADGAKFGAAGVDLGGDEARAVIAAAAPVIAWLDAREPGVRVRSISVKTSGPRVLVSLDPNSTLDPRPRALRFDPPWADELVLAARDAERMIGEACVRALERRTARKS
jgi:hypothetical protein